MPTPDSDRIAHIDQALARLSPRWVTWIVQTLQQHGPMRPGQLADALPWAGIWPIQHRLAHMLDNGLVHRHRYGLYEPSAVAQALPPLHRALATWHRDHLAPHAGEPLADAERTEIALTCLAPRGSTATLHTLHGGEAMTHGELRRNTGLPAGSASSRFQRLHTDGLLHRSGPPDNPRYALTDAARALIPLYQALETWSRHPEPTADAVRNALQQPAHGHERATAAARRSPSFTGLFSHEPAPQPKVPPWVTAASHPSRHR